MKEDNLPFWETNINPIVGFYVEPFIIHPEDARYLPEDDID